MKILSKAALFTAGAATLIAVSPANARHDRWGRGDGIDAGDVIAGALVIGGIAAIASAASKSNRYDNGYGYRDRDYGRYGGYNSDYGYYRDGYGSRQAVDQCVRAAQRDASRYGWARVTDVSNIERVRGGYEVRGRLVVETNGRGRDYGYRYDSYGRDYDKGRFSCTSRYGRVDYVDVSGLRGGYYGDRRYDDRRHDDRRYDDRYGNRY